MVRLCTELRPGDCCLSLASAILAAVLHYDMGTHRMLLGKVLFVLLTV
jgi:hypothetical protein